MRTIILVEDDDAIQETVKMILDMEGYETIIYSNGDVILTSHFEVPGLFIFDRQLSGTDGLDLCRLVKSREATAQVPVMILSANPQIGALAREAGADGYLEKPFKMQALRQIVARYLPPQ